MRAFMALIAGLYPTILGAQFTRPPLFADTLGSAMRADLVHQAVRQPHVLHWWEAASVAGFTLAVMSQDEGTTDEIREHPTPTAANLASAFRRVGQPEVYAALPLAVLTTGLAAGDARIARAGGRMAATVLLSTAAFQSLKLVTGRARPDAGEGAWRFSPFSGNGSLPSGHSAVAFALATSLSHELHNPITTVVLYTAALGTAWSRIYDQRHWASDVVFGAAVGVVSAQVVYGRWRIFGLRPPGFLLDADGAGIQVTFPLPTH
jgi:membrane-associated phospholipid phosphatase